MSHQRLFPSFPIPHVGHFCPAGKPPPPVPPIEFWKTGRRKLTRNPVITIAEAVSNIVTPVLKWSRSYGVITRALAMEDVDLDGKPEILICKAGIGMACISHIDGSEEWVLNVGAHIGVDSRAAHIEDIDEDGRLEILVGSVNYNIYLVDETGAIIWSYASGGEVNGHPAIIDIDGDGVKEAIIASQDYKLYCLKSDGTFKWSFDVGALTGGQLSIADIDGDGVLELVIAQQTLTKIYALRPDGTIKYSYYTGVVDGLCGSTPQVLYDSDGDGLLEAHFTMWRWDAWALEHNLAYKWRADIADEGGGCLGVFDIDGDGVVEGLFNWCYYTKTQCHNCVNGTLEWTYDATRAQGFFPEGCIVDIDNDGAYEILLCERSPGYLICVSSAGAEEWSYSTGGHVFGIVLYDFDGDGYLEIVIGNSDYNVYMIEG